MRNIAAAIAVIVLGLTLSMYGAYRADMTAASQRIATNSQVLSTRYGDIQYAVEGEGPPVLLIHGAGGGHDQGRLLGKIVLAGDYAQIAVSRFGYLHSPVPQDASVTAQAAAYAALLDHMGWNSVVVVAGSAGGPSALQFAHDYPDRTSALVLVSAVTKPMPPGEQDARQIAVIQAIQRSDFLFWLVTKAFQSQFLALLGVPPDVYARLTPEERALAQEMLDVMHPMSQRVTGSFREGEQAPLDVTELARIVAPTLILHARDDSLVAIEHAEHAHRSIRQSRLVLYDTGGHGLLAQVSSVRQQVRECLNSAQAAPLP